MSTPWTPEQRIAAYKRAGITKIVYMPGWKTHNRDTATGKTFGPVHGLVIHHTAGDWDHDIDGARYCYRGSDDLPGPVCHDFLGEDGTLYVIGHGRTNHAGTTTQAVKDAIVAERAPDGERTQGPENVDANDFLYGLEIENRGDGKDPYEPAQYDVAVRWAAAHCRHYGWSANSAWGHKEITTRKPDPSFSMNTFRADVTRRLTPPKTVPTTGGNVPLRASLSRPEGYTLIANTAKTVYWTVEHIDQPADHGAGGKSVLTNSSFSAVVSLTVDAAVDTLVTVTPVREEYGTTARSFLASATLAVKAGVHTYAFSSIGDVADGWNLVFDIESSSGVSVTWLGLAMQSDPLA